MVRRGHNGLKSAALLPWPMGFVFGTLTFTALCYDAGTYFPSSESPITHGMGRQPSSSSVHAPLAWMLPAICWLGSLLSRLSIPAMKRLAGEVRAQVRTPQHDPVLARIEPAHGEHFRPRAFEPPGPAKSATYGSNRPISAGVAWIQARLTRVVAERSPPNTMSSLAKVIAGLILFAACGQALGQTAGFRVSVVVLPERASTSMPLDLPTPPQARMLPASRDAKRLLYGGNPVAARRFYENTLPELGFYLSRQDAGGAVWDRADVRVELRFYPVIGDDATGIHVMVSPRPAAG
jgi:hypothetical protein